MHKKTTETSSKIPKTKSKNTGIEDTRNVFNIPLQDHTNNSHSLNVQGSGSKSKYITQREFCVKEDAEHVTSSRGVITWRHHVTSSRGVIT